MFKIFTTIPHVMFGVWGIIMAVWAIVEILNLNEGNLKRLKIVSVLSGVFMWLAYIIGGWWYVVYYAADKAIIKAGPFPAAHSFYMEAKEHVFFVLLLLSVLLPIIIYSNNLLANKNVRRLAIVVLIIIVALGLGMEGAGSIITKGLKAGLLNS